MKQDGKYLEDALQDEMRKISDTGFHFRRLYDSYSIQGRALPSQPSDFFVAYNGSCFHIEAKTSKETNLRLKMFSQYADLKRWEMSGVIGAVVIHFYAVDRLFVMPVSRLTNQPSWKCDEIGIEARNLEVAIRTIIGA